MLIQIDDESVRFGAHCFTYSAYYLNRDNLVGFTNAAALKTVLFQWVRVLLETLGSDCTLYLPFNFEDEWVQALKATLTGQTVSLTAVQVEENGWACPIDNLKSFIVSPHITQKESDELFHRLRRQEFIDALIAAEVISS